MYNIKRIEIFIAILLGAVNFIVTGIIGMIESDYFQLTKLFFIISWLLSLLYIIYIGNKNPISSVYSISFFLYYYQVPFLQNNAEKSVGVYRFSVIEPIVFEYYFIYSFLFIINMFVVFYLAIKFQKKDKLFQFPNYLKKIIFPSLVVASVLLGITIVKAGGFNGFVALDKFESVSEAKVLFFTWKDVVIIFFTLVIFSELSKFEKVTYHSLIMCFIIIEFLTAKRLLMMCYFLYIYIVYFGRISILSFILMIIAIFFSNFIKYTYYILKNVFVGTVKLGEIFWFDWQDFFVDTILIGEFSAHLNLTYLNILNQVPYYKDDFLKLILSLFPFSSYFELNYLTSGERLKLFLAEPWSGLASGIYITPYFSFFILGILLIYVIYLLCFDFFQKMSYKSGLFQLVFVCLLPFLTFYIQREELILIFKRFYIFFPLCLIFYMFVRFYVFVLRKIK